MALPKSISMTTRPRSNSSASAEPGERRAGIITAGDRSVAVGIDLQQRECAEDVGQVGCSGGAQIGSVEFGETTDPQQPERPDHLVFEQLQHAQDPGFAV